MMKSKEDREPEEKSYEETLKDIVTGALQATVDERESDMLMLNMKDLSAAVEVSEGTNLRDNSGVKTVVVAGKLNSSASKFSVESVDIYAGAKILNQENFDKIPLEDKTITATIHIVDGEFTSLVDSTYLFNKNVTLEGNSEGFGDFTVLKGKIDLSQFTLPELQEKLDNLVSSAVQIRISSELGFDMTDLDTEKLNLIQEKVAKIAKGHVVYNITFDCDYTNEEFLDRLKGISKDVQSQTSVQGKVKTRLNLAGGMLKNKDYFTVQGAIVKSHGSKNIKSLLDKFDKVSIHDKNEIEVDIREQKF